MTETGEDALRSGYLSQESKKRFTLLAGVLGGVFFLLQFLAPMAVMFAMMPAMMVGWSVETFDLSNAALYRGEIHLVQTTMSFGEADARSSPSRLVRLGPEGVQEVASLEGWTPRLLAEGDRLWLIASDRIAILETDRIEAVPVSEPLGDICDPFLLGGAPAVIETRPDGVRLLQWQAGGWRERGPLYGVRDVCCLQGLEDDDGLLLVREAGRSLYSTRPAADPPRWTVALSDPGEWHLLDLDGRPAVVSLSRRGLFRVVRLEGSRWTSVVNAHVGGGAMIEDIVAFQERAGAPLTVVSEGLPGSLKVRTWNGERFDEERRLGRSSLFPSGMTLFMTMPHVGTLLLSLLLAFILAGMMRTHRVGVHRHEGREVAYATLTRRALAQVADAAILGMPAVVLFWGMFSDFEPLLESGPLFPLRFFAQMAAAIAWALLALVGFAVTEGRWGWTPGKLLTGIRVVGTDLRSCGVGRALVRNLLKLVDGFFNFLIGILMVAFTVEWQRLGDLAARTIVIRGEGSPG